MSEERIHRLQQFYPFRKERKHTAPLDRYVWRILTSDFNAMLMNLIVNKGYEFKMPYNLGNILIGKDKIKKSYINENGELIVGYPFYKGKAFIPQVRTDYLYRFYWLRGKVKNIKGYTYIPSKPWKNRLKEILNDPDDKRDYSYVKNSF